MTITTRFNMGQKVRHPRNGIAMITAIDIEVKDDRSDPIINYHVFHSKHDNGESNFADCYEESELEELFNQ